MTVNFRDKEYSIKEFVPIEEILKTIQIIMDLSLAPEFGMYMPGPLMVYTKIFGARLFMDIEFTEDELDNALPLYDELVQANVEVPITNDSYATFINLLNNTVKKLEKYQTSAYGILDSLKKDYNNLDFDAEKIQELQEKIKNKENIELLSEVMDKMG